MTQVVDFVSPKHTATRIWAARIVAMLADAIQIVVWPFFVEGGASPANDVLDVVVAVAIVSLLGWHWAFLPSMVAELVPGLDLVPSWTAAVLFATRKGSKPVEAVVT